jgi:hypothetical protein
VRRYHRTGAGIEACGLASVLSRRRQYPDIFLKLSPIDAIRALFARIDSEVSASGVMAAGAAGARIR